MSRMWFMVDVDSTQRLPDDTIGGTPVTSGSNGTTGTAEGPTAPGSVVVVPEGHGPSPADGPSDQGQRFAPHNPHTRRLRSWRALLVLVVVALALALLGWAVDTYLLASPLQASGVVQADTTAQLNLPTTGPIAKVDVVPGVRVAAGQVLASQDDTALQAKLTSDQAKLTADQTALAQLQAGPTAAQRQQLSAQVAQAQVALAAAQTKLGQTTQTENASVASAQAQVQTAQALLAADQLTFQNDAPSCTTATPPANCATDQRQVQVDQGTLTAAQSALAAAQANQQAAISAAQSAVTQASAALATAQAAEAVGTQPPTADQLSAAQALIQQDQSAIVADQNAIAQTQLKAPFAGFVAAVNGAPGDIATSEGVRQPTAPAPVSSQSSTGIQLFPQSPDQQTATPPTTAPLVELNSLHSKIVIEVPETAISQVHTGQTATASLPAFPNTTFPVTVRQILPNTVTQNGKVYVLVDLTANAQALQQARRVDAGSGSVGQATGFTVNVSF